MIFKGDYMEFRIVGYDKEDTEFANPITLAVLNSFNKAHELRKQMEEDYNNVRIQLIKNGVVIKEFTKETERRSKIKIAVAIIIAFIGVMVGGTTGLTTVVVILIILWIFFGGKR